MRAGRHLIPTESRLDAHGPQATNTNIRGEHFIDSALAKVREQVRALVSPKTAALR
jgi:hypothetical protein